MNHRGITLTELLIALGLLGLIAMFAVPKVLNSSGGNAAWNASAKETIRTIKDAYDLYRIENRPEASTTSADIISDKLNYVAIDSTTVINGPGGGGCYVTMDCDSFTCYRLHNGAMLLHLNNDQFNGNADTNAVFFVFDPDGKNTPGQDSLGLILARTGRVITFGELDQTYSSNNDSMGSGDCANPSWFSWD